MLRIIIFILLVIVIGVVVGYLLFRHEVEDFLHKAVTKNSQKELEFELRKKQRERENLGSSIGQEYIKSELDKEIDEYKRQIDELKTK